MKNIGYIGLGIVNPSSKLYIYEPDTRIKKLIRILEKIKKSL